MRRSLYERDTRLGLAPTITVEWLDEKEFERKATDLIRLVFQLLNPNSVALFVSSDHDLRLEAIKSRNPCVHGRGHKFPLSNTLLGKVLEETGDIWVKELSALGHRIVPIYRGITDIQSVRILPFQLDPHTQLLLMVDYTDRPEVDPVKRIEPLIDLFSDSLLARIERSVIEKGSLNIPIPILLRRILTPFMDIALDFIPIESFGLLIWGVPSLGEDILEVNGSRPLNPGPFSFRWTMGPLRQASLRKKQASEKTRYFPITIGDEVVGNLSILIDENEGYVDDCEVFVKIISWALERELKLISDIMMGGVRAKVGSGNPYSAAIRVLDEWLNASRYNEYLTMGLVRLQFEGLDFRRERGRDLKRLNINLCVEIENALRKGDAVVHCSGGHIALIFPRTSSEGADSALRRLCNMLEGKKIGLNGSLIRVLSTDYRMLCYPGDLPNEEMVLEECSEAFLPR